MTFELYPLFPFLALGLVALVAMLMSVLVSNASRVGYFSVAGLAAVGVGSAAYGQHYPAKVAGLPATAAWVLSGKHPPAVVLETLHRTAEAHAIRADDLAERMRLWLPVLLVLTIGGGVTLWYGLAIFGPWLELLREMLERLND